MRDVRRAGRRSLHGRLHVGFARGCDTSESASRLREVVLGSAAEYFIEGHHESVSSRTDMEDLFEKMRLAERAAHEGLEIEASDQDIDYFIEAFRAGVTTTL